MNIGLSGGTQEPPSPNLGALIVPIIGFVYIVICGQEVVPYQKWV